MGRASGLLWLRKPADFWLLRLRQSMAGAPLRTLSLPLKSMVLLK